MAAEGHQVSVSFPERPGGFATAAPCHRLQDRHNCPLRHSSGALRGCPKHCSVAHPHNDTKQGWLGHHCQHRGAWTEPCSALGRGWGEQQGWEEPGRTQSGAVTDTHTPCFSTQPTVLPRSVPSLGLMSAIFGALCSSLSLSLLCLQPPPCSLPVLPTPGERDLTLKGSSQPRSHCDKHKMLS